MSIDITIVETGLANLASVVAAFHRLGANVSLERDPEKIRLADRVVVPGVGNFGAAMERLTRLDIHQSIAERVEKDQPTLGICLGLQIFGLGSEESPQTLGLGVIRAHVTGISSSMISPQMGWNKIVASTNTNFLENGYAYFANSFSFDRIPEGWAGATCTYGTEMVAALERGTFLGCQFHPELSGLYGQRLLSRWVNQEVRTC